MTWAQKLPPSGQMLQGHGGSCSHEHLWNKGCLYERVPSSNTRPRVAVGQQTTVKHSHYKEALKGLPAFAQVALALEARHMEAPGGSGHRQSEE